MITSCATALMMFTSPMYRCAGNDGSELDLFFRDCRIERAVHRHITVNEMPVTVVMPLDRSLRSEENGIEVLRSDLPDGVTLVLELKERPVMTYYLDGKSVAVRTFTCAPFAGRAR